MIFPSYSLFCFGFGFFFWRGLASCFFVQSIINCGVQSRDFTGTQVTASAFFSNNNNNNTNREAPPRLEEFSTNLWFT